jgi:glycosyltransferase involved in cell wall biosynthesis
VTAAGRPSVSVIVPTHERADLCIRAVRSALAQTVAPEEVLVWDDGSSAGTLERLRRLAAHEPRVRLHEGVAAGTPAVGRNRLIGLARGEWVAMLDDDDEWLPDKLESQQRYLDAWDVVGSAVRRRSNNGVYSPHVGPVGRRALYRDNLLVLSTVAMRRSLAQRGFRETRGLAGLEDYCMWLDLADAGARIVATLDVVAIYDDGGADRLSNDASKLQQRLASHMLGRWRERPGDRAAAAGALVHAARFAKLRARSFVRGSPSDLD